MNEPAPPPNKRHPLTDAERHKRFIETAREAGTDESEEAFDRAFKAVVTPAMSAAAKPE